MITLCNLTGRMGNIYVDLTAVLLTMVHVLWLACEHRSWSSNPCEKKYIKIAVPPLLYLPNELCVKVSQCGLSPVSEC